MTYDEFVKKWDNKTLDYDGYYGGQCMDVYRMYCKEVLNIPQSSPVVGAKDVWETHNEFLKKVDFPQKGDIVVWDAFEGNQYGHIAIFQEFDGNGFISFDQNWPVGSKCHRQKHNFMSVIGYLRGIIKDMDAAEKAKYEDTIRSLNTEIGRVTVERDKALDMLDKEKHGHRETLEKYTHCNFEREEVWKKYRGCMANKTEAMSVLDKIKFLLGNG